MARLFPWVCYDNGIDIRKQSAGKFYLRIPPHLHEKIALIAQAHSKSLNLLAQEALEKSVTA